jgi:hypothetical protein
MPNTYKGTSIQRADWTVWFDVREGLKELAEVRGQDTIVPYLPGRIERTRVKDKRDIELYGWIKGATESAYWTLLKEMQTLFDPAATPGDLVVPLADGTTATIRARALNMIPEEEDHRGNAQHFSVGLVAVAPDWTIA